MLVDLIKNLKVFPDQGACIVYLGHLWWQGSVKFRHCDSTHVNKEMKQV